MELLSRKDRSHKMSGSKPKSAKAVLVHSTEKLLKDRETNRIALIPSKCYSLTQIRFFIFLIQSETRIRLEQILQ